MEFIKFILGKIIIVTIMLWILYFATVVFNVHIGIIDLIINYGRNILTPIATVCLVPYIILSILDNRIVDIIIGVVLGGLILIYLVRYVI